MELKLSVDETNPVSTTICHEIRINSAPPSCNFRKVNNPVKKTGGVISLTEV
jgi:hypothetical protein